MLNSKAMEDERWRRLGGLYHAALDTPAAERSGFLDRACPDPTLRVEVEALLAQGTGDDLLNSTLQTSVQAPPRSRLTAGTLLGPYQIVKEIGSGGMGVVYQARDTRLERTVAVKVLPDHIARSTEIRQRFEREARTVASLNHPHICVLHDIGRQNDVGYMVMEFIDGPSLAERLSKGPLPLEQALEFALQIADAVDRAHRAGVTHRDVKPANIMLTRDGVKVLDFGIAKFRFAAGPDLATLGQGLTAEGAVMGTPQYMAPEQFEGTPADARSDIWAFGAVLYEMLTGRKAFTGQSYSGLVSAIQAGHPPPLSLKPLAPWLDRLVYRCLSKDPEDRYQSMRDVVLELRQPPLADRPLAPPTAHPSRWLWWGTAGCALMAAVASISVWRKAGEAGLPARFEIYPPTGSRFSGGATDTEGSAISPDGRMLAFMATNAQGERLLHLRSLDSLESRALPGTEAAGRPFWSPNSKALGFVANGKLKRFDLVGGTLATLCNSLIPRGATWSENGVILFADAAIGLQRIPESGGTPSVVTKLDGPPGEQTHTYPQFLPGGQQFLFLLRHTDAEKGGIFLGALDGRAPVKIQPSAFNGLYDSASRRLLYIQGVGTLLARRLDLATGKALGDPAVLAELVGGVGVNGYGEFSVSQTGSLFYARGAVTRKTRFAWRDRTGKLLEWVGPPVEPGYGYALSPDDQRLAYTSGVKQSDVWVMAVATGVSTRISFGRGDKPQWSGDGKTIYYTSLNGIQRKASDGSGEEALFLKGGPHDFVQSISPDERHLLFGFADILILPLVGQRQPAPYVQSKYKEADARFSPDGRWVAYGSDESGRNEVYIQGFPDRRGKWLVSTEGGQFPSWRADGQELYWIANDNRTVIATPLQLQADGVKPGRSTALFRLGPGVNFFNFQPTHDGRRFLTREPDLSEPTDLPMVVVQKWAAALRD